MNLRICMISVIICSFNQAGTIMTPELSQRIENPSNRQLINADGTAVFQLLNGLTKTVDCLVTFIDSHMKQLPSRISVFLTGTNPDVSMFYLSKLQEFRPTYVVTENTRAASNQYSSLDALLIIESWSDLANSTDLIDLCGRDCRFGVVITGILADERSFMEEANRTVELFWTERITMVVILGTVGETLLAARSQSFRPKELLRPSDPHLIGKCSNNVWTNGSESFAPMKMNSGMVRLAAVENTPYSFGVRENGTVVDVRGMEYRILKAVAKSLNFKTSASLVEWGEETTLEEELVEEFNTSDVIDLAIGGLHWTLIDGIEFATAYDVVKIVWMVPVHTNISLLGLISPLGPKIWYFVIATLVFGGVLKQLLFKKMSFLEIFALVIGAGWSEQPKSPPYRIKFMSWVLFGFLLTQFYLASLAGQLMAHGDVYIDTMQELVDSGISLGGTATHEEMFALKDGEEEDRDSTITKISDKFIVFDNDEYERKLQDLRQGKNSSLALVVVQNISLLNRNINKKNCHELKEVIASTPIGFAARKKLSYLTQIDKTLVRLMQSGIVAQMIGRKKHMEQLSNPDDPFEEDDNLRLDDIAPGFLLLVIGYFAGIVCLFGEIVVNWWVNRRGKKNVERVTEMKKLRRGQTRIGKFYEKKGQGTGNNGDLKKRVLKPNVIIGYYDKNGVAWRIV